MSRRYEALTRRELAGAFVVAMRAPHRRSFLTPIPAPGQVWPRAFYADALARIVPALALPLPTDWRLRKAIAVLGIQVPS